MGQTLQRSKAQVLNESTKLESLSLDLLYSTEAERSCFLLTQTLEEGKDSLK